MLNTLLVRLVSGLIQQFVKNLTPQTVKEGIDDAMDQVEGKHPLADLVLKALRDALDIPDDIGGDED